MLLIIEFPHTSPGTPYAYTGWTPWSTCSTSCGTGVQTRTQTNCTGDCGPTCSAPLNQTQPCSIGVPYYLSAWSDWGNCSQYCGAGVQTRNQTCLGTCANSSASCQGGAVSLQTASCTGGGIKLNPVCCISYFILQRVYQSYGQAGVHLATAAQSMIAILISHLMLKFLQLWPRQLHAFSSL